MPLQATRTAWRAGAVELAASHPVMDRLLSHHGPPRPGPGAGPAARFEALASSIAYQQLAGKAAASIWARVVAEVGTPFDPAAVLAAGSVRLRACGLSNAKVAALLDLAAKSAAGKVRLDRIARLSDQEVIDHVTVVRGIGPWTAQMFLMFDLRRLDVWTSGRPAITACEPGSRRRSRWTPCRPNVSSGSSASPSPRTAPYSPGGAGAKPTRSRDPSERRRGRMVIRER